MNYSKIRKVQNPSYGTEGAAGIDFYIPEFDSSFCDKFKEMNSSAEIINKNIWIPAHSRTLIPSGIKVNIPKGFALVGLNKSGIASKKGLILGPQLIDEDYQGEIFFGLVNTTTGAIEVKEGEKIVQLVLLPIAKPIGGLCEVPIDKLYETTTIRADGGFGSTGN